MNTAATRLVWLLPVWALFLAVSTLTHQPDYTTDFPAYAAYVTTTWFLVSHLVFSVVGACLAAVGGAALWASLPDRSRLAACGMAAFVAAQVLVTAVVGIAAFAQPAIGRAFLDGAESTARSLNEDVYGPDVVVTVIVGLVLLILGAAVLAGSAQRSMLAPVWATRTLAVAVPLFAVSGFTVEILQPLAGLAIMTGSIGIARSVNRLTAPTSSHRPQPAPAV